ncbi:MAG: hypothetical protein Q9226_007614 [Calogaya cf. arnoldii]
MSRRWNPAAHAAFRNTGPEPTQSRSQSSLTAPLSVSTTHMSPRWTPAADVAFRNTGPEPADAGFLIQGDSREFADAPARVSTGANALSLLGSRRRQSLDELIQDAQRPVVKRSIAPPDARLVDNTATMFEQMPGQYEVNAPDERVFNTALQEASSSRKRAGAQSDWDCLLDEVPSGVSQYTPEGHKESATKKRSARDLDADELQGGHTAFSPLTKKRAVDESEHPQYLSYHAVPVASDRDLTPKDIRTAREELVDQLVKFGYVTADVLANAFALSSKICNNVGCDQLHLSEDCTLELMCTGCGLMGHVPPDCMERCDRCKGRGHVYDRCTAQHKPGMPYPPQQLMPVLRPSWARERVVAPLIDRLMAAARAQSVNENV